jgi:hypothetical protein
VLEFLKERSQEPYVGMDKAFLDTLQEWLRNGAEILVLFRYSRARGKKSLEFFSSFDALSARLRELRPQTQVVASGRLNSRFAERSMMPRLKPVFAVFPMVLSSWLLKPFAERQAACLGFTTKQGNRTRS